MTRKNKILTIVLSVLSVVVLIVVLSSTIFTVGKIEVRWASERDNLSSVTEQSIVTSSGLTFGTNVFFVDKDDAADRLEQTYPYMAVLNIETLFPNILIINARERDEVFALQMPTKYLLVDSDFKVLKIVGGDYTPTDTGAIKITGDFDFSNYAAGDFIEADTKLLAFTTLQQSFYENYDEANGVNALTDMLDLLKSATYTETKIVFQTFMGVQIEMYNPSYKQQQKVSMLYQVLATLDTVQKTAGTIIIGDNGDKVQGSYTANV